MAKVTKQAVKHTGKARKEVIVAQLVEKMDQSKGLVFTDYKGITHIQLENLKKDLKTMDSTIIIAKNSLLMLSMKQSKKYGDIKDIEALEQSTATLFINGDMVEPLKRLQKVIKEMGLPKVKFGILEGNITDEAGVMKIAALPTRDTLIAQFIGTLNSPIQGLVVTLNGTIQKFVMTLDAIAKTKPATVTPATATESTTQSAEETTEPVTAESTETPASDQQSETTNETEADASEASAEKSETEEKTETNDEGGEK